MCLFGARRRLCFCVFLLLLLILFLSPHRAFSARLNQRKFVLLLNDQDVKKEGQGNLNAETFDVEEDSDQPDDELNEFQDIRVGDLDPGSWKVIAEGFADAQIGNGDRARDENRAVEAEDNLYIAGVHKMIDAASHGDPDIMADSVHNFQQAALQGHAHAQSTLAFLYGNGICVKHSDAKAVLYHSFAANGGNSQSKLALAYSYLRQQNNEEAVKLYAELARTAVAGFSSPLDSPLVEPVRLNNGLEENKDALRRSRGEEDDDFQILEYHAHKGNAAAMFKVGLFYYSGLRGVRRNDGKALDWFLKAIEKGESSPMEFVGEIYARSHGVERNFTKSLDWFRAALRHKRFSAYNGIGYLYMKGLGVEKRNYSMARECFRKAAEHDDPDGHYNLGVLYLKGKGVKKDIEAASKCFVRAANAGHPKAYYQLATLFHGGMGAKKDLAMATVLYKMVAERGPWGSLMRWALESYLKGDIGKALLLYSRAAELGYEVAQSNAAWILERYPEEEYCLGEWGLCETAERYRRAHTLWWHAAEQGNNDAALLIGDAYYYGRGTERDLQRAAGAYNHARLQANAQAMFNLGYMHEHGEGLPLDLHLAKRYYDEALGTDPAGALPVYLALAGLWLRQHHNDSILVKLVDSLPDLIPKVGEWFKTIILDEGNITLLTLFACLLAVLYLRRRRITAQAALVPPPVG